MARRYGRPSRRPTTRYYYSSGSGRSVGLERALQHIEDARNLSRELGGADKDVKRYFFSLPPWQLRGILDEYGHRYGAAAQRYAEETLEKWRTGAVHMSGTVAERLFSLLPPRMPLAAKYQLTEELWRHLGPRSRKRMRVGLDADVREATGMLEDYLESAVVHFRVPEQLERRFDWLARGDVAVKQDLLNNFLRQERALVTEGLGAQLPILLAHLNSRNGELTTNATQILKVGNHEVEVVIDRSLHGVRLEDWTHARNLGAGSDRTGSFAVYLMIAAVLALLYQCSG